jgi:hypothetical protein
MLDTLNEPLLTEAEQLETILTQPCDGQETAWVDEFTHVLMQVENSLSQHRTISEGRLLGCAAPSNRGPFASLPRHVKALRRSLETIQGQLHGLLDTVQTSFLTHEKLERLQREGTVIMQSLRKVHNTETALMMEIAMRDTGTGD